jgi:hypothetical protein
VSRSSRRCETENTLKYRKGTHHVYVPKNARIPEEWCRATFRKCGLGEDDIDLLVPKKN